MRTIILAVAMASAIAAAGQDTPAWWPPPLSPDSAIHGATYIYERPLASFNHPDDGRPQALIAVRCPRTGLYWRVLVEGHLMQCVRPGDTLTSEPPTP